MKPSSHHNQSGFTLIGVLVALLILAAVIIPITQVLIRGERVVDLARQRYQATLFAQEGLELTQNLRDSNWFAKESIDWLDSLCQENKGERQYTIDPEIVRQELPLGPVSDTLLYEQPNNTFNHAISTNPTIFDRLMTIDCLTKNDNPPYVTVTASVIWENPLADPKATEVVIKQELYNWLPTS